jgi:hypothetical protein
MPSSFINERSAEMILVPNIINTLAAHHFRVTPIFYWATREGGNMSKECFVDTPVKLLALYARRPKVIYPGMNRIFVRLNDLLFARAEIFRSKGIFAFAGVPLANNLDSLLLSAPCIYFSLENVCNEDLIEIGLDEEKKPVAVFRNQVGTDEIVSRIEKLPLMDWRQALKLIDETRRSDYRGFHHHGLYGDLYKPVYLIVRENI